MSYQPISKIYQKYINNISTAANLPLIVIVKKPTVKPTAATTTTTNVMDILMLKNHTISNGKLKHLINTIKICLTKYLQNQSQ